MNRRKIVIRRSILGSWLAYMRQGDGLMVIANNFKDWQAAIDWAVLYIARERSAA